MTTTPPQNDSGLIAGGLPEAALLPAGGIAQLFFQRARQLGPRPFLHRWEGDGWAAWSWTETAARVTGVARGLMAHEVQPGDRVLLVSENRVEWQVSALGIMAARAITLKTAIRR